MIKEYNLDKGFLVSAAWEAGIRNLSHEERGKILLILMDYQASGGSEIPNLEGISDCAKMFCLCVLPQIDNRLENSANGRKGGRPKKEEHVTREDKNPPFQNENEDKNPTLREDETSEKLKISKDKISQDELRQDKSSSSSVCACAPVREDEGDEEEKQIDAKKGTVERDGAFAAFMAEYPKKYRASEARRMFDELGIFDTAELLSLLSRWKRCENWQKEGGRYIPSPDKFLREIYGFRLEPQEHSGSFDTDEFFGAALRRSYTEPMNGEYPSA